MKKILLGILLAPIAFSIGFAAASPDISETAITQLLFPNVSYLNSLRAYTFYIWANVRTNGGNRRFLQKGGKEPMYRNLADSTKLDSFVGRATQSSVSRAVTNTIEANRWQFYATTYDETDGVRFFVGLATSPAIEVTYDVARTIGTGATNSDSSNNLSVGGIAGGSLDGPICCAAYTSNRSSITDIREFQFTQRVTPDMILYTGIGFSSAPTTLFGTGNYPMDFSINRTTGTTLGNVTDSVMQPPVFLPEN